jgi:hypothetical protein
MVPNGHLHTHFISYMMGDSTRFMNNMPNQLEPPEQDPEFLYEGKNGITKYEKKKGSLQLMSMTNRNSTSL